jgi:hypothetical protein
MPTNLLYGWFNLSQLLSDVLRKEFYRKVFPEWEWPTGVREDTHSGPKIVHFKVNKPEGIGSRSLLNLISISDLACAGVYGGIVEIPGVSPEVKLPMGIGFTNYFYVDSIDKVNAEALSSHIQAKPVFRPRNVSMLLEARPA